MSSPPFSPFSPFSPLSPLRPIPPFPVPSPLPAPIPTPVPVPIAGPQNDPWFWTTIALAILFLVAMIYIFLTYPKGKSLKTPGIDVGDLSA